MIVVLLATTKPALGAGDLSPAQLSTLSYEQKRGAAIPLDAEFRDAGDAPVPLRRFFHGLPVVLILADYECPHLCSVVLAGFLESARQLKQTAGRDYEIVVVSIRPGEKPATAAARQYTCASRYGRTEEGGAEGWHFLVPGGAAVRSLADSIGFHYEYEAGSRQFAHPSGIVILTPEGKVSRYLLGIEFPPKELQQALVTASKREIGPLAQRLLLLCFRYDPTTGKYGLAISRLLGVSGLLTAFGLAAMILHFRRNERRAASMP
jgi:protein SCO1/2